MVFRAQLSPLARRYGAAAFALCLLAILFLSLAPADATPAPDLGGDKVRHAMAYFVLTGLGLLAFGPRAVLLGGILLLGAGVEIAQALMGLGRQGDLADLAANLSGEAAALLVWLAWRRWRREG
ncbi:hypothetical protein [Phenylobacterium sp.]|jgi:4-amino-4-deoxy-L-arabinose transferase-like glycosyltransferase|uniref:hypothetical protein n=1 Tax=Phenylobacterium sp. TaxID=1871053 RepID=UPI0040350C06